MIHYRRLAALLLGAWLGASILTDVAVTRNFQAVDRFLETPGSVSTSSQLDELGRNRVRVILRRNAGEENNWIFENWERAEILLGTGLLLLLIFGGRPKKLMMGLCAGMLVIVLAEHFLLAPGIVDLGRRVDDLPATDPASKRFWMLHGVYSGMDILKMLLGFGLGARIAIRRKADPELFAREYAATPERGGPRGNGHV